MASPSKQAVLPATRLRLVPSRTGEPAPRSAPLAMWHLLSLDAPSVAALWVVFAGWCAGVRVPFFDPAAMFAAVWMLYAADRLLDARTLAAGLSSPELEERHRFHHRHRNVFVPCIAATTLPLAYCLHRLPPPVLHLYALLVSLLAGWLLLVHAQTEPSAGTRRLPKEFAVGIFFPAAVFIPTVARAPELRLALLPGALLFAGVCTLNCLFLYAWEHPLDRTRAHATTRWALRHLLPLAALLTVTATVTSLLLGWQQPPLLGQPDQLGFGMSPLLPHASAAPAACALSVAFLMLLHGQQRRFSPLRLRALADLALLTPVLLLLLSRAVSLR